MRLNQPEPTPPARRAFWIIVVLVAGAALLLLRNPISKEPPALETPTRSPAARGASQVISFESTLPHEIGPPGYVSSTPCGKCHEKEFKSWHRSYHRSMTQFMRPETVLADFDHTVLETRGERFTLTRRNDEFWVSIQDIPSRLDGHTSGVANSLPPRGPVRVRLGLVTGSHHMQVFWLPGLYGNLQIGFPFTWLIEDQRWVPRHDTFIRDPEAAPPIENWNMVCIRCHTTGARPRPDKARGVFDSDVAQLGIACEACHGPGQAHIALRRSLAKAPATDGSEAADPIVQPEDLSAHAASQVCGFCHSMKWFDKHEGWEQKGFRYRPGDDLDATTPVVRATQIDQQPWLKDVLKRYPTLLKDFFWDDGMIRVSGREYNGLLESPCYQRGELSCLSCHSLHRSDPNDQLARRMDGNHACLQCHDAFARHIERHTHHPATSSGSLCYNCHMPHTTYGILSAIRSHQIDSPDLKTTQAVGRPNACNLCHLDKTLAWTDRRLVAWYGHAPAPLGEEESTIAAGLLWLLKGDAGQRALVAWGMGWGPAREASGADWEARFLSELLSDRYGAVRYIAYHSLKHLPGFDAFEYDFVAPERRREQWKREAIEIWSAAWRAKPRPPQPALLLDQDRARRREIQRLLTEQDSRPVHLRE